ncbi:MAG TPA: hypothetical protein VG845_02310 [Dehalococcoidia bacterium]|nr:hypothetical protein [Dehalococcoidia bacterium]
MNDDLVSLPQVQRELSTTRSTLYRLLREESIRPVRRAGSGKRSYISRAEVELVRQALTSTRPRTRWVEVVHWLHQFGLTPGTLVSNAEITAGRATSTADILGWLTYFEETGFRPQLSPEARDIFALDARPLSLKAGAEAQDPTLGRSNPDDVRAAAELAAMLGLLDRYESGELSVRYSLPLSLSSHIVSWGNPVSNVVARLIYQAKRIGGEQFRVVDPALDPPFRWVTDDAERASLEVGRRPLQYWLRTADGRPVLRARRSNTVLVRETDAGPVVFEPETDAAGNLTSDLLLVSRLPNILGNREPALENSIILFSGTHGPGSRASTMLLANTSPSRKGLEQLSLRIEKSGARWFQALFAVRLEQGEQYLEPASLSPAVGRGGEEDLWFAQVDVTAEGLRQARDQLASLSVAYRT